MLATKDYTSYIKHSIKLPSLSLTREDLKAHRKLFFTIASTVWILSGLYALLAYTPQYASESSVLIKDSAITANYTTTDSYKTTSSASSNPVLNTMGLLKSDIIMTALWENFLQRHPEEKRKLRLKNMKDWSRSYQDGSEYIKSKNQPGTDIIYLTFRWSNPELAQEGMQVVVDAFREASRRLNQAEHHQRYVDLTNQVADVEQQLVTVRQQISHFKKQNGIYNVDSEVENYAKNRIDFEIAAITAKAQAADYQNQYSAYQSALGMNPNKAVKAVAVGRNATLGKLYDQQYSLTQQYASLKPRYTEEHPKMQELQGQIDKIESSIRAEIARSGGDPNAPLLKASAITDDTRGDAVNQMLLASAQSKGANQKVRLMHNYLNNLDARMKRLPQVEEQLANLREKETALSSSYNTLQQKALEAKMRETQTLSNVFVIDAPKVPKGADFPRRTHILFIGLILGALAGMAAIMLKRQLRPEARMLDLPIPSANL